METIKNMIFPIIMYFIFVAIGEWGLGKLWYEPINGIPLILHGYWFRGLLTIFLSWLMYSMCAAVIINSENDDGKKAGGLITVILVGLWISDLHDVYVNGGSAFGPAITDAFIYILASAPDVLQIAGLVTAWKYDR